MIKVKEIPVEVFLLENVWKDIQNVKTMLNESHLDISDPPFDRSLKDPSKILYPPLWEGLNYLDEKFKTTNKKKKSEEVHYWWTSGSDWTEDEMAALHICLKITSDPKLVVPSGYYKSDDTLKKDYPDLLLDVSKDDLLSLSWPDTVHPHVDHFYSKLRQVISVPFLDTDSEDKNEVYTDELWTSFVSCLGVDAKRSTIESRPRDTFLLPLGSRVTSTVVVDSALWDRAQDSGLMFCYQESQLHGKTAGNLNGQKAAEALASAATNHERAGWYTDVQEIFGVAIIHTSFEFYHMLLPRTYVMKLRNGIALESNEFIELRSYRGANRKRLDITDPKQRLEIVKLMDAILTYKKVGKPLIGRYNV